MAAAAFWAAVFAEVSAFFASGLTGVAAADEAAGFLAVVSATFADRDSWVVLCAEEDGATAVLV